MRSQIMNRLFFLVSLFAMLLAPAWANSTETFPDNLPTFSCETQPLTRDGLKMVLSNRERFAKACLACIGDECAMRVWPAGYESRETLCRNTYCSPKKVKKMVFSEGYNMSYKYRYSISAYGRANFIEGEYLTGEPKGVTGKSTQESHLNLIKKSLNRVQYEPVVINGRAKSLINLETIFEIGANYDE